MKKCLVLIVVLQFILIGLVNAQWTAVNNGLGAHFPTSMYAMPGYEVIWLGKFGGGVFKTLDNGDNWNNINGDLANLNVNDIRPFGTGTSMYVSTDGGPYFTMDESTYTNCTSTGLTNTDITYFGVGGNDPQEFAIGTNGGGVFYSANETGPWSPSNTGLSGSSLFVNDICYGSNAVSTYSVMCSDGGVYVCDSTLANPWIQKNNGLSGNSLIVNKIVSLGNLLVIATNEGAFISGDLGDNWTPLIPNEKFNTILFWPTAASPTGFLVCFFGINGYYTVDAANIIQIDMSGVSGEVTCCAANSSYLFIGAEVTGGSGSIYRKPMDQILAIQDENNEIPQKFSLKQNYPNPFNPQTNIIFNLPQASTISLKIYNIKGEQIKTLIEEQKRSAGEHSMQWNGTDDSNQGVASGIYFIKLQSEEYTNIKRCVFIK